MSSIARQYWQLTKPRVVALIVFTAFVGMLLAHVDVPPGTPVPPPELPPWRTALLGFLGIWLAAASAAAINQLLDARIDAKMTRPSWRPIVVVQITPVKALVFALALATLSMTILTVWVNPLTAELTFGSMIGYAVIYTVWLKRATPQNIVIGGLAGAAPPALGWTAVTGQLHPHALLLVLIIFVWTPPHFWALAIFRRDDYARAMVPMLPVTHGVEYTRLQILFYTILLCAVTILPWAVHPQMSGGFYLGGALVLDAVFLYYAIRMLNPPGELFAMKMFHYSIVYLMALFAFLLADHWLLPQTDTVASVLQKIG